MSAELDRVAAKTPLRAIDLSRYEAQEPDDLASPNPTAQQHARLAAALSRAHAAHAYLRGRRAHLALLDAEAGRNAWLVGNWQLEAELRAVEGELAAARRAIDEVTVRRQRAQEAAGGELRGLEEAWRRGVGRAVATEAAAEGVRREVLELRRVV